MNKLTKLFLLSIAAITFTFNLYSQVIAKSQNEVVIHLKGGYSFTDSKWSFSHPMFMNGVETKKIMDGKSLKGSFIEAGIEFQKNSAGWRFMFGISLSEIIVNPDNLSLF